MSSYPGVRTTDTEWIPKCTADGPSVRLWTVRLLCRKTSRISGAFPYPTRVWCTLRRGYLNWRVPLYAPNRMTKCAAGGVLRGTANKKRRTQYENHPGMPLL